MCMKHNTHFRPSYFFLRFNFSIIVTSLFSCVSVTKTIPQIRDVTEACSHVSIVNVLFGILLGRILEKKKGKKSALAGNRTRIYCLEGNNANLYTTNATCVGGNDECLLYQLTVVSGQTSNGSTQVGSSSSSRDTELLHNEDTHEMTVRVILHTTTHSQGPS